MTAPASRGEQGQTTQGEQRQDNTGRTETDNAERAVMVSGGRGTA